MNAESCRTGLLKGLIAMKKSATASAPAAHPVGAGAAVDVVLVVSPVDDVVALVTVDVVFRIVVVVVAGVGVDVVAPSVPVDYCRHGRILLFARAAHCAAVMAGTMPATRWRRCSPGNRLATIGIRNVSADARAALGRRKPSAH
jgi:hypothetical protein